MTVRSERASELRRIGARVRALREAAGMSQAQLADASGIHRVSVSRLENGRLDLGVSSLRSVATALGVRPSDLLD